MTPLGSGAEDRGATAARQRTGTAAKMVIAMICTTAAEWKTMAALAARARR